VSEPAVYAASLRTDDEHGRLLRRLVLNKAEVPESLGRRELRVRGDPIPIGSRAFEIIEVLVQPAGNEGLRGYAFGVGHAGVAASLVHLVGTGDSVCRFGDPSRICHKLAKNELDIGTEQYGELVRICALASSGQAGVLFLAHDDGPS
jgi:hypothetical protein